MKYGKKKIKYNNGGLVARKEFKGIGSIEGTVAGNQSYLKSSVSGSMRKGGTTLTGSVSRDNKGNTATNYSLEKQLPNKSSVGIKVRKEPKLTYHKKLKGGFNLNLEATKKGGVMRISKPL